MPIDIKPVVKTTTRTTVITTIDLDANQIAQILRDHVGAFDADVEFDTGHDFLRGARMTTKSETLEEEEGRPAT